MCQICAQNVLAYQSTGGAAYASSSEGATAPQYGGSGANTGGTQTATSNVNINGVLSGDKWAGSTLTYSFPTLTTQYDAGYGNELTNNFFAATQGIKDGIRYAMGLVSQYTNLVTSEVSPSTQADVRVAGSFEADPTAYAYYPGNWTKAGDVWYGSSYTAYNTAIKGQYEWATSIHELGHALGLKHGHETGGPGNTAMQTAFDQMAYSIMTYRSYQGGPATGYTNEEFGYAQTFMMFDIAALQTMYGANFTTNSGNSTYTWSPTTGEMFINGVGQGTPGANRVFMTIWDGNGVDTYDFSNYSSNLTINLTPGAFSITSATQIANLGSGNTAPGNIFNALQYGTDVRSLIENATGGSGNDGITGNAAANYLYGNGGNDTINAGDGDDILRGGAGTDSLTGGNGSDLFYFRGADMGNGVIDTVTDGGTTTTDLIRIDGVQYFNLTVSTVSGHARISTNYSGANFGLIDVTTAGTSPIIVATSASVIDPTTITAASRANLQLTWFDWANSQSYTQFTEIFNSSGVRDRQFGTYDGTNGRWDFLWDPTNANSTWTYRYDYFNNANQQTQQQGQYDAGGTWIQTYDPTSAQDYSYTITYYNGSGTATQVQSFYDAGPLNGGSGITTFDAANNQAYSQYTTYYDNLGRADTLNGIYDGVNGTWWVDFDQANVQAWQSLTVLYNQAGVVTQQWYTMDNGTIVNL